MPKRVPTPEEWKESYISGVKAKKEKWYKRFLETDGIAAAAASDEAQRRYEAAMSNPEILKLRQKRLQELSDEDFKAPVRKAGSSIYERGAVAKADKAAKRVAPYLSKIAEILPTLPPKTDDVDANIDNRVKPIARALRELKLRGGK